MTDVIVSKNTLPVVTHGQGSLSYSGTDELLMFSDDRHTNLLIHTDYYHLSTQLLRDYSLKQQAITTKGTARIILGDGVFSNSCAFFSATEARDAYISTIQGITSWQSIQDLEGISPENIPPLVPAYFQVEPSWSFEASDFSVDFRIKPKPTTTSGILVQHGGLELRIESNRVVAQLDSLSAVAIIRTSELDFSVWNHIVLARKGQQLSLLSNGKTHDFVRLRFNFSVIVGSGVLRVGGGTEETQYEGKLAELRIQLGECLYGTQYNVPTVNYGNRHSLAFIGDDGIGRSLLSTGTNIIGGGDGDGFTYLPATIDTALVANVGFVTNSTSRLIFALPTTCAFGEKFRVIGNSTGGWKISQNANQYIRTLEGFSTTGIQGYVESRAGSSYAEIELLCVEENLGFKATMICGSSYVN